MGRKHQEEENKGNRTFNNSFIEKTIDKIRNIFKKKDIRKKKDIGKQDNRTDKVELEEQEVYEMQ